MNTGFRAVITAIVVLCVQVVANLLAGVVLLGEITDREEHGQKVTPEMYLLGWGSVIGAIVLAVATVFLARRVSMARWPIVVLEGVVIVAGFVNLVAGVPQGVVGIALGVVVLVCLLNRRTEDWFSAARTG